MLDINFIKENKEIILTAIKNKKAKPVDLDAVLSLYEKKKAFSQKLSEINRLRNEAAKERNVEEGKRLKEESQNLESELEKITKEFISLMTKIPNIPSADTPIGEDESGNKIVRQVGEKPKFNFKPKAHWDLGKDLGIIDSDKAAEVSGARFTYLKGDLAMLQFSLLHFVLSILTSAEKLSVIAQEANLKVSITPFIPIVPPIMMKSAVMNRMARLHPLDERYYLAEDDLVLIGSAEHTLGPIHMDEIIEAKQLPLRYFAYTPSFRREAGSYGKDTRGILRLHQFDKIEMETFVSPESAYQEQDFLVGIQEYLMRTLKLPYQVVVICTGDMGLPDHRQFDIETWMPGQDTYRETHTSDYMGAYQARRLNTRTRRESKELEYVHMNDATALAMGRGLIAILENYQQEDGSVVIPEVLRTYMGKDVIKRKS